MDLTDKAEERINILEYKSEENTQNKARRDEKNEAHRRESEDRVWKERGNAAKVLNEGIMTKNSPNLMQDQVPSQHYQKEEHLQSQAGHIQRKLHLDTSH